MQEQERPGVQRTLYRQAGGNVPTEATAAREVHVERVEGETVVVDRSRVAQLTGQRVSLNQSTAGRIEASSAQADRSAIRNLEAERAVALRSAVALALVRDLRAHRTRIGVLRADRVEVEQGTIGLAFVRDLRGPALLRLPLGVVLAFAGGVLSGLLLALTTRSRRR